MADDPKFPRVTFRQTATSDGTPIRVPVLSAPEDTSMTRQEWNQAGPEVGSGDVSPQGMAGLGEAVVTLTPEQLAEEQRLEMAALSDGSTSADWAAAAPEVGSRDLSPRGRDTIDQERLGSMPHVGPPAAPQSATPDWVNFSPPAPGGRSGTPASSEPEVPLSPEQIKINRAIAAEARREGGPDQSILLNLKNQAEQARISNNELQAERDQGISEADAFGQSVIDEHNRVFDQTESALESLRERNESLFSQQLDPMRIFNQGNGADVFSTQLGVAVGAMLQAFQNQAFPGTNAVNASQRIVEQAIERDIAAQQANFGRGVQGIDAERSAMNLARENGMSMADSAEFARIRALEHTSSRLASIAQGHRGTQLGLQLEQQANVFRMQSEQRRKAMEQLQAAQAASNVRRPRRAAPAIIPAGWEVNPDSTNRAGFMALSPKERSDIMMQLGEITEGTGAAQQLKRLIAERGLATMDRELAGYIDGLRTRLTFVIKSSEQGGSLDAGLVQTVGRLTGSNSEVTLTSEDQGRIRSLIDLFDSRSRILGNHSGLRRAQVTGDATQSAAEVLGRQEYSSSEEQESAEGTSVGRAYVERVGSTIRDGGGRSTPGAMGAVLDFARGLGSGN